MGTDHPRTSRPPLPQRARSTRRVAALAAGVLLLVAPTTRAGDQLAPSDPPGPASFTAPAESAAAPTPAPIDPDSRPLGSSRTAPNSTASGHPAAAAPRDGASVGILRTTLSLGLVISLAVAAAAVAKRLSRNRAGLAAAFGPGGPAPAGILEILGRYPLSRGQTLILLRVQGRILLLAHAAGARIGRAGGGGLNTLCDITDSDEVASIIAAVREHDGDSLSARFRSMLTRFDGGAEAPAAEAEMDPAGRRVVGTTDEGDRAELWDDRTHGPQKLQLVGETEPPPAPPMDAVTSLQRRLDALRGAGGRA